MTALEEQREDQALGAAWRRAEAALPEGNTMTLSCMADEGYVAIAQALPTASWGENASDALDDLYVRLTALADALEGG